MYLTGSWSSPGLRPHLDRGVIGVMTNPKIGNFRDPAWAWAADNGCFNAKTYVGDGAWFAWLTRQDPTGCLFAVAPDVVADHEATIARSLPWLARIRSADFPAAFVLQNGATVDSVPWDAFDVAFIGGDDAFKLGGADHLIAEAQARGKAVHVGRVNSDRRFQRFALMGVDSCDGTFLAFGPETNTPRLLAWIRRHATQPALWMTHALTHAA